MSTLSRASPPSPASRRRRPRPSPMPRGRGPSRLRSGRRGWRSVSPSLYGFVKENEPVSPEEISTEFLSLANLNGDARGIVERLVEGDPRFFWEGEDLKTAHAGSLALDEAPYDVFDVETTGSAAGKGGAITEFGAMKLVRGEVVDQFSTLVNPGRPIDPFVVRLTGITDRMVADAPPIDEVMPRFEEFVEGCVLVGHNVHFDCSFVTAARGGAKLPNEVLDTLKLARCLVPGLKRYRLSALVSHFGVRQAPNHRALADAAATAEVFKKLLKLLRSAGMGSGGDGRRKVGRLVEEVAEVRIRETESELHALILEAREIKRLLPRFNSAGRGDRASWYIRLDTNEAYPVPERVSENASEAGLIHLGPFRSAGVLDTCVEALGRIFPLKRCSGDGEACFYGQIGRCAPCMGMGEEEYRREVVEEVVALLRGEGGEEHLRALVAERQRLATELEFEAAARLRDLIAGIERVRLSRAVVSAEGVQAVAAPSTEPGVIEVFILRAGRLISHRGFEPKDTKGLIGFASEALARPAPNGPASGKQGSNEARIVAAYLRRRSTGVEAVQLREARDLLKVAESVAEASGEGAASLA